MTKQERLSIIHKMKKYGIKHYIVSMTRYDGSVAKFGFTKCYYDDKTFDHDIKFYHDMSGYEYFDVIHYHS